eukprot:scaffold1271_cov167-Amphora_coffeaeformis.AAC.14
MNRELRSRRASAPTSGNGYPHMHGAMMIQGHIKLSDHELAQYKERHDLCQTPIKTDRIKARMPKRASLCEPLKLTNKEGDHTNYKENPPQPDHHTITRAEESLEDVSPRTKKSNDRTRRRGSISQGIALACPKRSSPAAVQWSSPTEISSLNQASVQTPPLASTHIECLDRHVQSGGLYDFPLNAAKDTLPLFRALRLGIFSSEQQFALSKHIKLMCALLFQMNDRTRPIDDIHSSQEYCTELVLTLTTVLAVGNKARDLFWGYSYGLVALLGIWKESQQRSQQAETTEARQKDLATACAAALNVLTYTEPSNRRDLMISENVWQHLIECLEYQIHQGAPSDAIQALDHIFQWYYPFPKCVKTNLVEILPGLVPKLWRTLKGYEAGNEELVASSSHLLWRAYSCPSGLRQVWSLDQTEALFMQMSKTMSIRIHEATLGMLQYWIADYANVRCVEDVQNFMRLCRSLKIHWDEPAIVRMGLNVLQALLQVVSVGVLKPDEQKQIASIAIEVVKQYDTPSELVFATRIMVFLLDGGILPLQYLLSFEFPRVARLLHGLVKATEDQGVRESCREALYSCLRILTANPTNGADLYVGDMISIFMKEVCEQLTTQATKDVITFDLLVLSQLVRTQAFSSEAAEIAIKLLKRIATHHHSARISTTCFEIITSILSATGGVAASACGAMVGLLRAVDVDELYYNRQYVANALVYALRHNIGSEEVSLAIADTWYQLCVMKDYFKEEFVKSIPLLLQCMTVNLMNLKFQKTACGILRMIASFGEATKMARETDTLPILADVLLAHCKSALLVSVGLGLMILLVDEETARSKLSGWSNALLCLGRVHIQNATILSEVFAAVSNIAVDNTAHRIVSARLEPALLELLCLAMRQFPNHAGIQINACMVLQSHTHHVTSLEIIDHKLDLVTPLVLSAGRNFSDCSQRARHILSRLDRTHQ